MKRLIYPLLIVSLICTMSACSKIVGKLATAYTASKDSTQVGQNLTPAEEDSVIIAFITKMYNEDLFYDDNFIDKHCSNHLKKKLWDDYYHAAHYDGEEVEGYATEEFTTVHQDTYGLNPQNGIIEVKSVGENWYTYEYYSDGFKGKRYVRAFIKDGEVILDALEPIYDETFDGNGGKTKSYR